MGVTGDYLTRAVRSHPVLMPTVVIVSLIAVTFMAAVSTKDKWIRIGLGVFSLASIGAVLVGVDSIKEREQPHVAMSVETGTNTVLKITVDASGAGLRPIDQMAVQVLGFETADELSTAELDDCEETAFFTLAQQEASYWLGSGLVQIRKVTFSKASSSKFPSESIQSFAPGRS